MFGSFALGNGETTWRKFGPQVTKAATQGKLPADPGEGGHPGHRPLPSLIVSAMGRIEGLPAIPQNCPLPFREILNAPSSGRAR